MAIASHAVGTPKPLTLRLLVGAFLIGAWSAQSPAVGDEIQIYKERKMYERQDIPGLDRGDHAIAQTIARATDRSANRHDPHCIYRSGLLGLDPYKGSRCVEMCVAMPNGKQPDISRVELFAGNTPKSLTACISECSIGWSKWYNGPVIEPSSGRVCATFKNWSHAYDRTIMMKIPYQASSKEQKSIK